MSMLQIKSEQSLKPVSGYMFWKVNSEMIEASGAAWQAGNLQFQSEKMVMEAYIFLFRKVSFNPSVFYVFSA